MRANTKEVHSRRAARKWLVRQGLRILKKEAPAIAQLGTHLADIHLLGITCAATEMQHGTYIVLSSAAAEHPVRLPVRHPCKVASMSFKRELRRACKQRAALATVRR